MKDALVGKITPEIVRDVLEQHQRLGKEETIRAIGELERVLEGLPKQAAVAEMIFGCSPMASRAIHLDLMFLGMKIAERALTGRVTQTHPSFGFGQQAA